MTILGIALVSALIGALFYFAREKGQTTSKALWIPLLWILIISSRPVSMWLHVNREITLEDRYTEGSPLDATYYAVLLIAGLLVLNRRWARVKPFLQANLPVLLFFLYCGLSVMWADSPAIAIKRWVKAIGDLVMILVMLTDPHPSLAIRRMFERVGFVLLPLSILFIFFIPSMGSSYDPIDHVTMFFGVTTFKNLLGVMSMFCGLGALWSFLGAWQRRADPNRTRLLLVHATAIAMAAGLIVKADSMTSLSCFGLAGMVMFFASSRWFERRPGHVFLLVAGATGVALFALFMDTGGSMLQSIGRNSTLTGRTQIWAAVLAQHINPVLGTGFESFWMGNRLESVWSLSQKGIEEAHNGYLELYLNLGWVGLAVLGMLIVSGYRNALVLFRRNPDAGRLRIAFLTAGLIYSCTEAGFRMMSPVWIGFLLAVLAVPDAERVTLPAVEDYPLRQSIPRRPVRVLQ
ncbi:O-antigen ligase family protein [Acidobacteria bacterium AB60]|nr:O-antigen ligase family protein [Acidobacteria bacterium AB60]